MAYRNLIVKSMCKISCKNEQLIIEDEEIHSVPIEDVVSVLIESRQSVITTAAISSLSQNGIVIFFCDEKHIPCSLLLPFSQHSRKLKVLNYQLSLGQPLKKRMWQTTVVQKIVNQATCLNLFGEESMAGHLLEKTKAVNSGDGLNIEAYCAARYFKTLFGKDFARSIDGNINAALNYGYAIFRGVIARNIANYGLEPCLGIHHVSEQNAFNLADDLIEPFRPIVDRLVSVLNLNNEDFDFDSTVKAQIVNLLNVDVVVDGKRQSAGYAAELAVKSFVKSLEQGENALSLPQLVELRQHRYE